MPATVRKHSKAHNGYKNPHWHVVSPEKGVVGHSSSQKKAEASARVRTQAHARKAKRGKCK